MCCIGKWTRFLAFFHPRMVFGTQHRKYDDDMCSYFFHFLTPQNNYLLFTRKIPQEMFNNLLGFPVWDSLMRLAFPSRDFYYYLILLYPSKVRMSEQVDHEKINGNSSNWDVAEGLPIIYLDNFPFPSINNMHYCEMYSLRRCNT